MAGKGTAWLLGTYVGHDGTAHRNDQTPQFVRELKKQCGVHWLNHRGLLLQKRIGAVREAWILTNPTDRDMTETIPKEQGYGPAELHLSGDRRPSSTPDQEPGRAGSNCQ